LVVGIPPTTVFERDISSTSAPVTIAIIFGKVDSPAIFSRTLLRGLFSFLGLGSEWNINHRIFAWLDSVFAANPLTIDCRRFWFLHRIERRQVERV
jgi:hypothetical protein